VALGKAVALAALGFVVVVAPPVVVVPVPQRRNEMVPNFGEGSGHFWYQMNVWQNYLSNWLMSFCFSRFCLFIIYPSGEDLKLPKNSKCSPLISLLSLKLWFCWQAMLKDSC